MSDPLSDSSMGMTAIPLTLSGSGLLSTDILSDDMVNFRPELGSDVMSLSQTQEDHNEERRALRTQNQFSREFQDVRNATVFATPVSLHDQMMRFANFIDNFPKVLPEDFQAIEYREEGNITQVHSTLDIQERKYYMEIARVLDEGGEGVLTVEINLHDLFMFDPILYAYLVKFPGQLIAGFDRVLEQTANYVIPALNIACGNFRLKTRPVNMRETLSVRELSPKNLSQLVQVTGMITRSSSIIPDIAVVVFRCEACAYSYRAAPENERFRPPARCPSCRKSHSWRPLYNIATFKTLQLITLQESPENVPQGETPRNITVHLWDELVEGCKPGDRVNLVCIYRAAQHRLNPRTRKIRTLFPVFLDCLAVEKDKSVADFSDETLRISDEDIESFNRVAEREDLYDYLAGSLAPSIFGMEDVKKGLLCMLFGGVEKMRSGKVVGRPEINILMVGDPGVAKSQLLHYVHKLSNRGMYTSGKGSSGVGLTAYITKDPEKGEFVLESGALVLSDRGICCIDEFDKLPVATRSVLHEAMEQRTISIAKAGVVASLNSRCSIVAAANPIASRYDPKKSIVDNINIEPTLLSRFDLVYLLRDEPNHNNDRRLARHVANLFVDSDANRIQHEFMPIKDLVLYISYAKLYCKPTLSVKAGEEIVDRYVEMRDRGRSRNTLAAAPRQLESIIRISEALARLRLAGRNADFVSNPNVEDRNNEVTVADVEEAHRLMQEAFSKSASDGYQEVDMSTIFTGLASEDYNQMYPRSYSPTHFFTE
ncbi:hypothetical protein PCE1_000853 [Barthelona sp. PCE]